MTTHSLRDLKSMTLYEMEALASNLAVPSYRGRQIFEWISKGAESFHEMKNVPKAVAKNFSKVARISKLNKSLVQKSQIDGTRKYLFELEDGNAIESVLMEYKYGSTICISSQAGCNMGCSFCASTRLGKARDLTAGEMLSQILDVNKDIGRKINHVVVMGTGEPFDNYDELSKFLKIINDGRGLNIGMRNITVSTCGIVPMIKKFADDFPQVNLAISLHATDDKLRSGMMPINNAYPIDSLIRACKSYTEQIGRRLTFEYTLIRNTNDSLEDAKKLAGLLSGMLCHVNLIPLNNVNECDDVSTDRNTAIKFQKTLEQMGIVSTIRRELGSDIDAACGQLRLKEHTKSR